MTVPRRIAALPNYIASGSNTAFQDAAPGHKFLGYFRNYQDSDGRVFDPYKGKARLVAPLPQPGPQNREEQKKLKTEFDDVLNEVCKLPASSIGQIAALRSRQQALIAHYGPNACRISTTSIAPFATGLGNEHPIENGFAFLTPYGLPYLAGSGVKGILRRAMQELRDDGVDGSTSEAINALFGPEIINQPEDAQRGALDFWDVFPNPAGGRLVVEIMTPHYGGYYQKDETPHDSGSPNPVSFLAVPAKSQFDFHVVCHPSRLPPSLQNRWRALLDRAFLHAFEWVGFGAKTSVGYGAMAATAAQTTAVHGSGNAVSANTSGAAAGGGTPATQNWPAAKLTLNPGTGEIKASFDGKTTAGVKGADADALRVALGDERLNKLRKNKELKGVSVQVEQQGNALLLKGLNPT
jgi:CRISPR-associated protein Cmr6